MNILHARLMILSTCLSLVVFFCLCVWSRPFLPSFLAFLHRKNFLWLFSPSSCNILAMLCMVFFPHENHDISTSQIIYNYITRTRLDVFLPTQVLGAKCCVELFSSYKHVQIKNLNCLRDSKGNPPFCKQQIEQRYQRTIVQRRLYTL